MYIQIKNPWRLLLFIIYPWQHMYIWVKKIREDIRKLIYLRYTVRKIGGVYKHTSLRVDTP